MKPDSSHEDQWMAYHLGELPEEDRARVEAELKANPDLAESYRQFAAAFSDWANENVPERPFDFQAFRVAQEGASAQIERVSSSASFRKTPSRPGRLAWTLTAAALFLFALSGTRFTLTFGNAHLQWGTTQRDSEKEEALQAQLDQTESQLASLEDAIGQNTEILHAVSQQSIGMERRFTEMVNQLAYYQQVEAGTRYRDTDKLMTQLAAWKARE